MKIKLLKHLRNRSKRKVGVFRQTNGKYKIIFDKNLYLDDLSSYEDGDECKVNTRYQLLEQDIDNLNEAIKSCEYWRNVFIRQEINTMKFGNHKRVY